MSFRFWPKLRVSVCTCMPVCVCVRVRVNAWCGCTRVCGCAASRSMFIALLSTILLCDSVRRARERALRARASSRTARVLGAAYFFGVCQKTEFFTLRRNRTQARVRALRDPRCATRVLDTCRRTFVRARARAYILLHYSLCVVLCATKD